MYMIKELEDVPVIQVTDFLPEFLIDEIFGLVEVLRDDFGSPGWSTGSDGAEINERHKKSLCAAKDIWFPMLIETGNPKKSSESITTPWVPSVLYELLEKYMFHQGISEYCRHARQEVFRLIPHQFPDGKMHIVSYGDEEYYNWHWDHSMPGGYYMYGESPPRNTMFTFNLLLCRNDMMIGGDSLFMSGDKTVSLPFQHNSMVIVPATVQHAAATVKMHSEDVWLNRRISCQFWMASTQKKSASLQENERWHLPQNL